MMNEACVQNFSDMTEPQRLEGGREFEWDLVEVEQGVEISRSDDFRLVKCYRNVGVRWIYPFVGCSKRHDNW